MKKAICVLLAAVCCCMMESPFVAYAQTSDVLSFEEAVALDAERVDWRAPNFGNGANALKYYIDTGTRYEVKVDSIDIKSLTNEGTILHTIKLQNPLSLNEIY